MVLISCAGKVSSPPPLSRSSDSGNSPNNNRDQPLKVGYALRRKGEVVYSWHRYCSFLIQVLLNKVHKSKISNKNTQITNNTQ
jgi:hypothetical protein